MHARSLLLATALLGACIPNDTAAKGGVAVTIVPSSTMRAGTFTTTEGWNVTIESATVGLSASLSACSGGDEFDYGATGSGAIDARAGGLLEIRAARSSRTCMMQVFPNRYFSDDFSGDSTGPSPESFVRGFATKTRGTNVGANVRFAFAVESLYNLEAAPKVSVTIPPGDKVDVRAELALEVIFRADARSKYTMDDVAAADENGDGLVTADELQNYHPSGDEKLPLGIVFAERLGLYAIRFLP